MAIAFGDKGALATSTTGTLTPALPPNTLEGHFLVAHISQGSTATLPTPAGWNLGIAITVGTHKEHFFWKFAGASEGTTSFTGGTTTNGMWGVISRYTGVPFRANPFHVAPVGGNSTFASPNHQGPAMTSTIAGAMAVWLWTTTDNSTTGAASGGATAAYSGSAYDSVVGLDASHFSAYKLQATAGSTGTVLIAASSGATTGVIRFMLDPTPSTEAPTVDAGSDATINSGDTFSRTATEDNGGATITARAWTIQSGPAGVGSTIGTAAALSWTPSTAGTYVLRYSATNSVGTGTDDVQVIVNPPAPVVGAGADATIASGATFSRTATETNSPTSRAWTIQSGPAGVGTTIGTAAALSWTPSTYGTYVLRYSATNAGGTGTDDVQVTVNPPAPTVDAGADASVTNRTAFARTATESGVSITSRSWTIQSGPTGVGSSLGSAAALSWTPTVPGTYTLRYSATNVGGTGTDDVIVTVTAVVISVAGSVTAQTSVSGSATSSPKLRVATKTQTVDPVALSSFIGTPRLRVATKTSTTDPVALSSFVGVPKLRITTKVGTTDPVATSGFVGTPKIRVVTKVATTDPIVTSDLTGALAVRRRITLSGLASATSSASGTPGRVRIFDADVAVIDTYGTGFLRIPGSGYFKVDATAVGTLSVIKTVGGAASATTSAVVVSRRVAAFQDAVASALVSAGARAAAVRKNTTDDVVAIVTVTPPHLRLTNRAYVLEPTVILTDAPPAYLLNIQPMGGTAGVETSLSFEQLRVVSTFKYYLDAESYMAAPLRRAILFSEEISAYGTMNYTGGNLVRTRRMFIDPVVALSRIVPVAAQRTVVYHPQVQIKITIPPPDLVKVTKFYGYLLLGESEIRERSVKIVITTANIEGYVNRHNTRDVLAIRGYVTAVADATGDLVWAPMWHRALAKSSLHGDLVALKLLSEEVHAQSMITRKIRVTKMMSTILAVMDDNGNFIPTTRPNAYSLAEEEQKPVVFSRTFTVLR